MKHRLPESVIQRICSVLERYRPVDRAILYGSTVKGNYKNGSEST